MKNLWVVANVIIGARPEPFFEACLAGVQEGIDFLILNDNSGNSENPNLQAYRASRLFKEGRSALIQSDLSRLSGFDEARNLCLQETGRRFPEQNVWVLYLDTDEVHSDGLTKITRKLLPRLPDSVAVVDGYFYQFIQTFDYYYSVDRRHNLLFKYHPDLRWEKPIHSELTGLSGKRIPTGYAYFHYGYVVSPENVLRRWRLYEQYDSLPYSLEGMRSETLFHGYEKWMIPFHGKHPESLALSLNRHEFPHHQQFSRMARRFLSRHPWWKLIGFLKAANWRLRLAFRNFQAWLACKGV